MITVMYELHTFPVTIAYYEVAAKKKNNNNKIGEVFLQSSFVVFEHSTVVQFYTDTVS